MTKAEIIQSAFETWGATGYQNTSLAALAGALGVTKTALYHHFRNKDDIFTAMYDTFFDSLADNVRPFFEEVLACAEGCADEAKILEAALLINGRITEFFAKNPWYFIFSLVKAHRNMDASFDVSARLKEKGLDFEKIDQIKNRLNEKKPYPTFFQFIFTASFCITAHFLGVLWAEGRLETGFHEITGRVNRFVRHGVGFRRETIDSLDWEALEKAAVWREIGGGGGRRKWLIKAVASAVAAVGPWAASMSMVAKKSGLSKSGLYAHFASKRDMLRQLFFEEFDDVIQHARNVSAKSGVPEEQLYLAMRAVESFLTSEPEFLTAIARIKTMRINFDMDRMEDIKKNMCHNRFYQVFSEIKNASGETLVDETTGSVILFLLTDTLIRKPDSMDYKAIPNESFRSLYRFIALGTDGVS